MNIPQILLGVATGICAAEEIFRFHDYVLASLQLSLAAFLVLRGSLCKK